MDREALGWGDRARGLATVHLVAKSQTQLKYLAGIPVQGTSVPSPIWEDSTCPGAAKTVNHNC